MDPRDLLRPSIAQVERYRAVESVEAAVARRGLSPDRILRLNANENPYGTPLRVQEALASFDQYHLYPDPESREIRALLADYTGMDARRIIVGNGSDEIIDLLFWLFVAPGESVMVPTPTFGMYAARAAVFGAGVRTVPRRPDFSLDSDAMEAALSSEMKLV
ncbi:MAG TPA: aminotransferase class I/II-fold pyridoxal phosphate-dependent enzyme, partial [Thermomicrobiales bacterium]